MMTNQELAEAIAYAFERSGTETFGGYARGSDVSKEMQAHLKELLAIQRARAAFVETPNAPHERASEASPLDAVVRRHCLED